MIGSYKLVGLLGGILMVGPATMAFADATLDKQLEDRVESRLKTDTKLDHLDVDVSNGVVTLGGEVANATERARAEKLARAEGAKTVVNKLQIDADKAIARVRDTADTKKSKIDERAAVEKERIDRQTAASKDRIEAHADSVNAQTKEASARKDEKLARTDETHKGGTVSDPWVTTKVKTKILADDLLSKSDINVDTDHEGVVTLKGTVPNAAGKTRALELARTTEGVRQVVDHLAVKAPVTK